MTVLISVADPCGLDSDPDPTFHLDSDPYPTFHFDSDPTFHFDSDPDPTFHFKSDPDPNFTKFLLKVLVTNNIKINLPRFVHLLNFLLQETCTYSIFTIPRLGKLPIYLLKPPSKSSDQARVAGEKVQIQENDRYGPSDPEQCRIAIITKI